MVWHFTGCSNGVGKGNYSNGAGGGAGHGGKGGSGIYNGIVSKGGQRYGSADLPCELGSGTQGSNLSCERVTGGGIIGNFSNLIMHQIWIVSVKPCDCLIFLYLLMLFHSFLYALFFGF